MYDTCFKCNSGQLREIATLYLLAKKFPGFQSFSINIQIILPENIKYIFFYIRMYFMDISIYKFILM